MKHLLLSILTIPFFSFLSFSQELSIVEKIENYSQVYPQEKAYIVTDRTNYISGEDIWFSTHLVHATTHKPTKLSTILYVDLINQVDGSVIETRNIEIIDGFGQGDFIAPYGVTSGNYELVAYSNYMRNFDSDFFFKKEITIISYEEPKESIQKEKKLEVQFFPEGGYLVNDIENLVALKVVCEAGELKETSGQILNDQKEVVGNFNTNENGIGLFFLLPKKGETYSAMMTINGKEKIYDLPQALESGYGLSVSHQIKDLNLTLKKSNKTLSFKGHQVIGQMRGVVLFSQQIDQDEEVNFTIHVDGYPTGVLHIIHVDNQQRPRSERLVFIDNDLNDFTIEFDDLNTNASRLQNQNPSFSVFNKDQKKVDGNYSLTIVDKKFDERTKTIQEYLFLESDLPGSVPNLSQYFDQSISKRKRVALQDQLMRTYGWRRFTWQEIEEEQQKLAYFPENGGYVRNFKLSKSITNDDPIEANLQFVIYDPFQAQEIRTDEYGEATFIGIDGKDTINYYLKANYRDGYKLKRKTVKQVYDNIQISPLTDMITKHMYNNEYNVGSLTAKNEQFVSEILSDPRIGQNYFDIFLDPIVVSERAETQERKRFDDVNKIHGHPTRRVVSEDVPQNYSFSEMISRVAGVVVAGDRFDPQITIRNESSINLTNEPFILLDGVPVDILAVARLTSNEIDFIDVLKGYDSVIYGSRGANGVIAVFTRRNILTQEEIIQNGTFASSIPGYYQTREYYNPMFIEEVDKRAIYSPTLYWNGNISTTDIEFTNPNYPANYVIKLEGITKDGTPIYYETNYEVE